MGVIPAESSVERVRHAEPTIYFVLCPSYHGATLLSLLLNNHSKVLCLGDTNPTRSFDQICSCGAKVSACEFWTSVRGLTGPYSGDDLPNLLPRYPYLSRSKALNHGLNTALSLSANAFGASAWRVAGKPARNFRGTYAGFLGLCQSWVAHRAFVDGEKSLVKFMAVASMGFPVNGVIHLTRDPRGFLHSARKYLPDWSTEELVSAWAVQHGRIRRLIGKFDRVPSMTLRYEDLAERPQVVMANISGFMGLAPEEVVRAPTVARKHHLIGNNMLRAFDGTVRTDNTWQTGLSVQDQEFALRGTGHLAGLFGYDA